MSSETNSVEAPQLSLRAILTGLIIAIPVGIANLYIMLRIGWSFGVSLVACVLSVVFWNLLARIVTKRFSILETNIAQTTASSAGYATGGSTAVAMAAIFMTSGTTVSPIAMFALIVLVGALGLLMTIPLKRRLIDVDDLPFPDGIATASILEGLYSRAEAAVRQLRLLVIFLAVGAIWGLLRATQIIVGAIEQAGVEAANATKKLASVPAFLRFPETLAIPYTSLWSNFKPRMVASFEYETSLMLVGAGMLAGLRIGLSILLGAFLLYFVFGPWLALKGLLPPDAMPVEGIYVFPAWAIFPGAALLVSASLTGFVLSSGVVRRALLLRRADAPPIAFNANTEIPLRWMWLGLIPVALALLAVANVALGLSVLQTSVLILLGFVAAAVAGRVTGETNNTPGGPLGKIGQVAMGVAAPGNLTANLFGAGAVAGAGATAADLLQDLKSGKLLGASARKQFVAQLIGCVGGAILVSIVWYRMFPTADAVRAFHSPVIMVWERVATVLTTGLDALPPVTKWASLIAAIVGIVLPALAAAFPRAARFIPSPIGIGLAWVIPFFACIPIAVGGILAGIWALLSRKSAERDLVAVASGVIAGESVVIAIATMAGAWIVSAG